MKKKKIIAVALGIVCLVGAFFAGFFLRDVTDPDMASLRFIVETYRKYYLEESDDFVSVMGNSIIDRYSEYFTKEEYEAVKNSSAGRRKGLGITYGTDTLTITSVKGNSPAEKAGIKGGEKITGIGMPSSDTFTNVNNADELKACFDDIPDDTPFRMRTEADGEEKIFLLEMKDYQEAYVFYQSSEGEYRFRDVNGGDMSLDFYGDSKLGLPSDTGYIKYTSFNGRGTSKKNGSSSWQMKTALQKFNEQRKTKLILDLRDNGGGYMDIMSDIASHFIGADNGSKQLVSKAVYKNGNSDKFNSSAVDYGNYGFEKIIVLANSGTASASEALIGAMLDYDYKKIVNVVLSAYFLTKTDEKGNNYLETVYRSYGKGIMQTTYENPFRGDALKLTTAKIYWPKSNVTIHGVGITKKLGQYSDRIFEPTYISGEDYELKKAISLAA